MFTKEELESLRSAVVKLEFFYTDLICKEENKLKKEYYNKQMKKMNNLGYKILEIINSEGDI